MIISLSLALIIIVTNSPIFSGFLIVTGLLDLFSMALFMNGLKDIAYYKNRNNNKKEWKKRKEVLK